MRARESNGCVRSTEASSMLRGSDEEPYSVMTTILGRDA